MVEVIEYVDEQDRSPFAKWFNKLGPKTAARVVVANTRLELGNFSNVKGVGGGVFENKLDFGPGYRIYFGKDGETLIILVGGGTKKRKNQAKEGSRRWH